ncbi:NAD+ synthase [Methanothermobacter sp. THM-2]|uniref:NAD+ synthase n=1 Tax=Methanothermobacter sp. THM-2 TaxID=2606912 RepID=UPI0013657542|nr:NAD+ synthase [Methanothermobacter sp. THM-2]QHN07559.1 NAD+ synthase [Methanothermobacter sp. THM-2]
MRHVPGLGPHVRERIEEFIKASVADSRTDGVVLGLSGGLDSSTVAYLAAGALGPDRVLGIIMPSATTPAEDLKHAELVAEENGIEYETVDIEPILESFSGICGHRASRLALANLKPRARMMVLYYHANSMNRLVAGTGNRTELLVGYFTKYGDGGVDILPIGGLYKKQVRMLAEELGVPSEIISKAPSAGLWPGQTDEEELGISYDVLDEILFLLVDKKMGVPEVASELGVPAEEVKRIQGMVRAAGHKLRPPEIADPGVI